jgi:hypothetical protein
MIFIIENKSLAHIIITDQDEVIITCDVHPDQAKELVSRSVLMDKLPKEISEQIAAISYEADFSLYAFNDEDTKAVIRDLLKAKKADTEPAKKAAKKGK